MASASTALRIFIALRCSSNGRLLLNQPTTKPKVVLPLHSSSSILTFARRRSNSAHSAITSSKIKKKSSRRKDTEEDDDDDTGDDAFEALFQMLEEDLKNDDLALNDNDDISEEDLAKLELELEEALKEDDELLGQLGSTVNEKIESKAEDEEVVAEDDYEDDEDEEVLVKLKNWQLKKLAYALRKGRRKTNIKNLAADLCLDRAVVLELLRDPPPNLVLLSDVLPDEPVPRMIEPETKPQETVPLETSDVAKPEAKVEMPVHVMQRNWSAQKRLKKVQLETLERVYRRSKRPTNSMISSIVHVTNLPRKKVLQWFEDRRAEEVPDHQLPYQPSSKF